MAGANLALMSRSAAVELLERKPRVFWGHVIRLLIERGWSPPAPDERAVDDLLAGMEAMHVPNDIRVLRVVDSSIPGLSPAENRVFVHLQVGMSNAQIADELGVSSQTVKYHLTNIYRKLGVANRTEAAMFSVEDWKPEEEE